MADIPEHKTKRLMSLNQDVFAVKPGNESAEQKAEPTRRKPQREPSPSMAQPVRPMARPAAADEAPATKKLLLALFAVVAVLVLLVAAGAVAGFHLYERIGELQQEIAQPADDPLAPLRERIALLEKSLDAASQETDKMDGDAQANVLQLTGRVRKVALDLSRLSAEMERQKKRLIETSARAERAQEQAAEQAGRVDTLSARVSALPTQSSAPAPSASSTDSQAREQVQALQARVDKMANEIRSIYRLLEQTR